MKRFAWWFLPVLVVAVLVFGVKPAVGVMVGFGLVAFTWAAFAAPFYIGWKLCKKFWQW